MKPHPGAKPGEWQGHYEPVKSAQHKKAAQASLVRQLAAVPYVTLHPANVAKQVRETRGK